MPFFPHTGSSREKSYSITVYHVAIFILKPLHCHFFTANQMIPRFLNYPFILEKQNIYFLVHLSWIQMQWNYSFKMNLNWTLSLISRKQVNDSIWFSLAPRSLSHYRLWQKTLLKAAGSLRIITVVSANDGQSQLIWRKIILIEYSLGAVEYCACLVNGSVCINGEGNEEITTWKYRFSFKKH